MNRENFVRAVRSTKTYSLSERRLSYFPDRIVGWMALGYWMHKSGVEKQRKMNNPKLGAMNRSLLMVVVLYTEHIARRRQKVSLQVDVWEFGSSWKDWRNYFSSTWKTGFPVAYVHLVSRYTSKKSADGVDVYAVILKREDNATVSLGAPKPSKKTVVTMLGSPDPLKWRVVGDSLQIKLPELKELPAPEELVTLDIFVLKLTYLTNKPKPKEIMRLPEEFRRYSKIRGI